MTGDVPAQTALRALEELRAHAEKIAPEALKLLGDAALIGDADVAHRLSTTVSDVEEILYAIQTACSDTVDEMEARAAEGETAQNQVLPPPEAVIERPGPRRPAPDPTAAPTPRVAPPQSPTPSGELSADSYEHATTVMEFVHDRKTRTVSIGTIAFHISPDKRLEPAAYEHLKDFLNGDPHFTYAGNGIYRLVADPERSDKEPRRSRRIVRRLAQTAIVVPPASADSAPETAAPELPAEPVVTTSTVEILPVSGEANEALRTARKELALFSRIEYLAYTKGYLSAKDIRTDEEVSTILDKQELAVLWRRLGGIRERILARILEVGANARWLEKTADSTKAYALAFYELRGANALEVHSQLQPLIEADFLPQAAPASTPPVLIEPVGSTIAKRPEPAPVASEPPTQEVKAEPASATEIAKPTLEFNFRRLLRPGTAPAWLSDAARGQIRTRVEELFTTLGADHISRDDMIVFAARTWGVPKDGVETMLQNLYDLRAIGKLVDGAPVFYLDPALRGSRPRAKALKEPGESAARPEKKAANPLDLHGAEIIDVIVDELTHVQQRMRPAQIVTALEARGTTVSESTVKKACRLLETYLVTAQATGTNRSPHAKSRGQKVLMTQIRDQRVKDAWKNDREGVVQAIRDGRTFDQYYESQQA